VYEVYWTQLRVRSVKIEDFDQSVQQIISFPKAGNPYLHNTRRIILNLFPYAIVYKIYNESLMVAHTVMHMKRKPDYWQERL
jgi:hypothetical protein